MDKLGYRTIKKASGYSYMLGLVDLPISSATAIQTRRSDLGKVQSNSCEMDD